MPTQTDNACINTNAKCPIEFELKDTHSRNLSFNSIRITSDHTSEEVLLEFDDLQPHSAKTKFLTIDGGGVKVIAILKVLEYLEKELKLPICKQFDYIAGTSTGGIIAALLTIPKEVGSSEPRYTATEVIKLFEEMSSVIFATTPISKIRKVISSLVCCLDISKYDNKPISDCADQYFSQLKISDTLIPILITAVNNKYNSVQVFSSCDPSTKECLLKDIVCATSAAPTYFPPHKMRILDNSEEYIDGGILCNNPSAVALRILLNKQGYYKLQSEDINILYMSLVYEELFKTANNPCCFLIRGGIDRFQLGSENLANEEVKSRIPPDQAYEIRIPIPPQYNSLDNANFANIEALKAIGANVADNIEVKQIIEDFFNIQKEEVMSLMGNDSMVDSIA